MLRYRYVQAIVMITESLHSAAEAAATSHAAAAAGEVIPTTEHVDRDVGACSAEQLVSRFVI